MERKAFERKMEEILEEAGIVYKEEVELEASSLQYIMVISAIEEEFDIELPDEFFAYNAISNKDSFMDSIYELVQGADA